MSAQEINGNPEAMSAFGKQLTAPELPTTLVQRIGTPPQLAGLFEGIAMSLLDKAATGVTAAYLAKVTEEMVTYSAKVTGAGAAYSTAELVSTMQLVASSAKLVQQGVGLAKSLTAAMGQQTGTSTAVTQPTPTEE